MLGPRLVGRKGVVLRPPTLEDQRRDLEWQLEPETTRFWGPRFMEITPDTALARLKRQAEGTNGIAWSIEFEGEHVGFTGIFDIDWRSRDGESGLFIGRHDLYGRGIASEAVRLRTRFAWDELNLHRVHNFVALGNRGSRRANEKAGYHQIGLLRDAWYRSGEWHHDWMGEVFPPAQREG